ncbi:hypothetical protein AX14_001858, partial [Amanita brunnescens Koide BX004]
TGIGTVDCARHDMKRPNSIGDLQKGERYVNMDYFLYSSLRNTAIKSIVASYDITCQWCQNFYKRMKEAFPPSWSINHSVDIRFLVPKFHLPAHMDKCHQDFSFNNAPHMGQTDGEAPERGWANINGLSYSTREMGPGSQQDTIEDHFGDWNWKKIIAMGSNLLRKIKVAIPKKVAQYQAWQQLSSILDPQQVSAWLAEIEAWERDLSSCANPFQPRLSPNVSQADVQLQLAQQDAVELQTDGMSVPSNISPSAMIYMGLELEEMQCKLCTDEQSLGPHAMALQLAQFQERKNIFYHKLVSWQEAQVLYIPGVTVLRATSLKEFSNIPNISIDKIPVLLPSNIGSQIPPGTNN